MMCLERPRMALSGVIVSGVILVGIAGLALGSLAVDRSSIVTPDRSDKRPSVKTNLAAQ